jgi:hypothetical protein
MERSGLIKREVRGKRTYRISLGRRPAIGAAAAQGQAGFDYDELARRLLVQVVRCISESEGGPSELSSSEVVLLRRLLSSGGAEKVGA